MNGNQDDKTETHAFEVICDVTFGISFVPRGVFEPMKRAHGKHSACVYYA